MWCFAVCMALYIDLDKSFTFWPTRYNLYFARNCSRENITNLTKENKINVTNYDVNVTTMSSHSNQYRQLSEQFRLLINLAKNLCFIVAM